MPTEVYLPRLTQTMDEGTVVEWLKAVGAAVAAGEAICAVESDKSAVELEAPGSGTLGRIDRGPGERVAVGATLGWILADGEAAGDLPTTAVDPGPIMPAAGGPKRATPVARKLAAEHGLDLAALAGTGPGGRVTKEDVLAAVADGGGGCEEGSEIVPLTGMRRAIAQRMAASARESAAVALSVEVELTRLEAARSAYNETAGEARRLTLTHLLCWAAVRGLTDHTALNGWVDDARIERPVGIHLGYAVGLGEGLVVPVLRDAEAFSPAELASELTGLSARARAGRLAQGQAGGGSFTVSSLGAQGVDVFAPILNPPEIAILGIGRARGRAIVEGEAVRPGLTAHLTHVFYNRPVDGETGAAYLATLRDILESQGVPLS